MEDRDLKNEYEYENDPRDRFLNTERSELRIFVPEGTDVRVIHSDNIKSHLTDKGIPGTLRGHWKSFGSISGLIVLGVLFHMGVAPDSYGIFAGAAGAFLGSLFWRGFEEDIRL